MLQYHAIEKCHKKIPLSNELSVQTREVFSCMKLCGKAGYSIKLVSQGFLKILKPFILLGSRAFVYLFPLDCACWLGSEVEEDTVDAGNFVCDAVCDVMKNCVGNLFYCGCHSVFCVDCSDDCRPALITAVVLDTYTLHIGYSNEVLPYLFCKAVVCKFFSENCVSFSECLKSVTCDRTETSYTETGAGEGLTASITLSESIATVAMFHLTSTKSCMRGVCYCLLLSRQNFSF